VPWDAGIPADRKTKAPSSDFDKGRLGPGAEPLRLASVQPDLRVRAGAGAVDADHRNLRPPAPRIDRGADQREGSHLGAGIDDRGKSRIATEIASASSS
jgi:hypothetical protein